MSAAYADWTACTKYDTIATKTCIADSAASQQDFAQQLAALNEQSDTALHACPDANQYNQVN